MTAETKAIIFSGLSTATVFFAALSTLDTANRLNRPKSGVGRTVLAAAMAGIMNAVLTQQAIAHAKLYASPQLTGLRLY